MLLKRINNIKNRCLFLILIFFATIFMKAANNPEKIIGVKAYKLQNDLSSSMQELKSVGINTIFAGLELNDRPNFRNIANKMGVNRFVIIPIFFDSDTLTKNENLFAITNEGKKASADWLKFVCPSRKGYRQDKIEFIKEIIQETNPAGISLDFIRHFVFWEKVYPGHTIRSMPSTCFCDSCMKYFQRDNNINIPKSIDAPQKYNRWLKRNCYDTWVEWRCELITTMVTEIVMAIRKINPNILVNIHTLPWRQNDYNGALKKIAGQDIKSLSRYVDFISPMTYTHMIKRTPQWISAVLEESHSISEARIIPSIQVSEVYRKETLGTGEFAKMYQSALGNNSSGIVFWSWEMLLHSPEKLKIIKNHSPGW